METSSRVLSLTDIKVVEGKIFDVFWGDKGWHDWSRFEKKYFNGKLTLALLKGKPMPKDKFKQLFQLLTEKK